MMKRIVFAPKTSEETVLEQANRRLAYEAALEGIVLLENDGVLPMKPGKVALFGTGGVLTIKGGTGSGEVHERHSVSILEGLEKAGFTVTTKPWLSDAEAEYQAKEDAYRAGIAKSIRRLQIKKLKDSMFGQKPEAAYGRAITQADIAGSDTDTALYVVARQAGEAADRRIELGENDLAPEELAHLKTLCAAYQSVILIINVGSSIDLSVLDEMTGIRAIVYYCQQGMEGGTALADLIAGKASPSGRLACTWAKRYGDIPFADEYSYRNGDVLHERYREGIFVGYRYFDTFDVQPRYCFGHGLSYTSFGITFSSIAADQTAITVQTVVTNTGACAGREVVQLYVSCPQGGMQKEFQRLAAFAKTRVLSPGESETLTLSFDLCGQASYDEAQSAFRLEQGDYLIRIGRSSRETALAARVCLDQSVAVSVHEAVCPLQAPLDQLEAPAIAPASLPEGLPAVAVLAASIETLTHTYATAAPAQDEAVQRIMARLSVQEKLRLLVGVGMLSGAPRMNVPGAVGNTTSALYHKGLINVALSDGPAGLRLSRCAVRKRNGSTRNTELNISFLRYLPDWVQRCATANPDKGELVYQHCTAFPVETALAQSWNEELLARVGKAIAGEMDAYGVTYWLAPGMNIQRNPLCGRNFEYFSEDPLLTGKLAAAITRGLQATGGAYATIKHFCCNNQEDNRNRSDSIVSERALREIYLRGFSIAVQEGGAKSVMTSYNKVNGVYTPNSYDLCTKVLRNEWAFSGVVMTDWFSTAQGLAGDALCLKAGNDLIMPGGGYHLRALKRAYKSGTLQAADIDRCAANVIASILRSNVAARPELSPFRQ